jgi:hypothetical protein
MDFFSAWFCGRGYNAVRLDWCIDLSGLDGTKARYVRSRQLYVQLIVKPISRCFNASAGVDKVVARLDCQIESSQRYRR